MQDKVTLLREKWAEALESGKYEQCKGMYRSGEKRCALGILLDVAKIYGFVTQKQYDEVDCGELEYEIMGNIITICMIGRHNDRGMKFPEIAAKLRNGEYDVLEERIAHGYT